MAVRFDAAADRLTHAGTYPQTSAGITVTMWMKIDVDRNDFSTQLRFSASPGGATIATFSTQSDGTSGPAYFTPTTSVQFADDLDAVTKWVPVAFSRSATGTTQKVYRRVGGGVTTTVTTNASGSGTTGTTGEICIGGRGSGDSSEWLNGSVAYVRIWSSELSQAEIEAEWASTTPVKSSTLHSNWPLATNTDLTDTVGGKTLVVQSGGALTTATGPSLGISRTMDGHGDAAAGFTGSVSVERPITGIGSAAAGFTGSTSVDRPITGVSPAAAGFTGSASVDRPITATSSAASDATGTASVDRPITGTAASSADMAGAVDVARSLDGNSGASDSLSGDLGTTRPLSASMGASSALTGDLTTVPETAVTLTGTASAASDLDGTLSLARQLGGKATAASSLTGNLTVTGEDSGPDLVLPLRMGTPTSAARYRSGVVTTAPRLRPGAASIST